MLTYIITINYILVLEYIKFKYIIYVIGVKYMKTNKSIVNLLPSFIMLTIILISFSNIFNLSSIDLKSLFIIGLVLIFPLSFLLQGILSYIYKSDPVIGLILSSITYLVIMFIFLNSSAFGYLLTNIAAFLIGYFSTKAFKNCKRNKK
jgi:hypothetical protein